MEEYVKTVSGNAVPKTKSVDAESLLKEKLKTMGTKSIEDLGKEEKVLKHYLEKLKKECFLFQTQIKAWQVSLKDKLERFKQTELDLNGVHQEIWSKRESFCTKADEINDEFGVLSNWWKAQMDFVCDLENFRRRKIEEKDRKEEIELLQKEVENLGMEIEALQEQQNATKIEVHSSKDGDSNTTRSEENLSSVVKHSEEISEKKKFSLGNADDEIVECSSEYTHENFLFSMMNVNRVRDAKQKQQRQKNRDNKKFIKRQIEHFH